MRKRKITNKKAFTLIELLAVIVILAIIALIAVPVIMNIINKANKSAFKDTAYGIINAGELYFAEQQLNPMGMQDDVTIPLPDTTNTLEIKGEVPEGTITITKEGDIALGLKNNRYCVTKGFDDEDITIIENYETCEFPKVLVTNKIMSSYDACIKSGNCVPGTEVSVQVNPTESYNFYVISDTGTKLTLIMDRNIGTQVAWYEDDDDNSTKELNNLGPITVLNYLNSETSDWTNISAIESYTYNNNLNGNRDAYSYQKLVITNGIGVLTSQDSSITTTLMGTSRARLLTYEEASDLKTANSNTTPTWLYTNLAPFNTTQTPYGYWFLSTEPPYSNGGYRMSFTGWIDDSPNVWVNYDHGARPVIELSK